MTANPEPSPEIDMTTLAPSPTVVRRPEIGVAQTRVVEADAPLDGPHRRAGCDLRNLRVRGGQRHPQDDPRESASSHWFSFVSETTALVKTTLANSRAPGKCENYAFPPPTLTQT